MGRITEYDKNRKKRLLLFIPVSLAVILILVISLERSQIVDRVFSVGYEGPMKILPEITIIDDKGIEAETYAEERHDMVSRDVKIYNEEEEETKDKTEEPRPIDEKQLEEDLSDQIAGKNYVMTYPSHTQVPYREDYVILKMVKPEYPKDALDRRIEGYVLVEVYVNESGHVSEAYARKVYGIKSFERASMDAVRQFEFKPVMEEGKPQSFWVSFLINFKLRG